MKQRNINHLKYNDLFVGNPIWEQMLHMQKCAIPALLEQTIVRPSRRLINQIDCIHRPHTDIALHRRTRITHMQAHAFRLGVLVRESLSSGMQA